MKRLHIAGIIATIFTIIGTTIFGIFSVNRMGIFFDFLLSFFLSLFPAFWFYFMMQGDDDYGTCTTMVTGMGVHLSGERPLKSEELQYVSSISNNLPKGEYCIATISFVILFIPIFPIKSLIYLKSEKNTYIPLLFPVGKYKVYWNHVKESYVFYIFPSIIILLIISYIVGKLL